MLNTCKSDGLGWGVTPDQVSGERVSNAQVMYLYDWDSFSKGEVIPDKLVLGHPGTRKAVMH